MLEKMKVDIIDLEKGKKIEVEKIKGNYDELKASMISDKTKSTE